MAHTQVYSVWDPRSYSYKYYECAENVNENPKPSKSLFTSAIGATVTEISYKLPAGARLVGEGKEAKGAVIHLGGTGEDSLPIVPILLGVGLLWYLWR